jgi:carbon monoxide dehydrogenase subunit G
LAEYLAVTLDVRRPVQTVWDALSDWERQSAWIIATRVRSTLQDGRGVGGGIEAWTGVGPLGFLDVMVVSEWEPPHRCTVEHVGKFVRGSGGFQVSDLGGGRSRVLWWERVEIPFGAAGRVGWRVVRPVAQWGVLASLKRFRRIVEGR